LILSTEGKKQAPQDGMSQKRRKREHRSKQGSPSARDASFNVKHRKKWTNQSTIVVERRKSSGARGVQH